MVSFVLFMVGVRLSRDLCGVVVFSSLIDVLFFVCFVVLRYGMVRVCNSWMSRVWYR